MLQLRQNSIILCQATTRLIGWSCRNMVYTSSVNRTENEQNIKLQLGKPVLTMFTKDNCSLCDDAKAKLDPYKGLFELEEIDITVPENKDWFDKYKYDIPVFHFNGDYLMRHRVHEGLLEKTLTDFKNKSIKDT